MPSQPAVTIQKVHTAYPASLCGNDLDEPMVRTRLARLLDAADFQPTDLPPAAIFCVRRLLDPMPAAINVHRSDLIRPPPDWQQALSAALDQLLRDAARPFEGVPPANAPAVIFRDRSELLACLASDWLAGALLSHWWWRSLLQSRLLTSALQECVLASWRESPEAIPAALHHVAQRGVALRFVGALQPHEVTLLLERVIAMFGLWHLPAVIARQTPPSVSETSHASSPLPPNRLAAQAPPWRAWAPELLAAQLPLEHQLLIGIALGLQRAPAVVRSSAFARDIARWREQGRDAAASPTIGNQGGAESVALLLDAAGESAPSRVTTVERRQAGPDAQAVDEALSQSVTASSDHPRRLAVLMPTEPASDLQAEPTPAPERPAAIQRLADAPALQSPESAPLSALATLDHDIEAASALAQWGAATVEVEQSFDTLGESTGHDSITTELGGLFYLINVGIHLGYYADFSAPLTPGIELNLFDFVTLVGRRLLADGEPVLDLPVGQDDRMSRMEIGVTDDDPVWALLGRLAGRGPEEPAGGNFVPPDHLPLDQWLTAQVTVIRARLAAAFGEGDPLEVGRRLCFERARAVISAPRLDLYFSLETHPIHLRLSGLDRDPGWVPAAGRFVAFHYEVGEVGGWRSEVRSQK